jgi:adenosylcobinamide-GDP ribazoletransferase
VKAFVLAWHFLTAIPVTRQQDITTPQSFANAMVWFPVVGLIIGLILAGAGAGLDSLTSRTVGDWLIIFILALMTRCLHLDGLADTVDGWVGGRTAEERLHIMRDPRIGAVGTVAVVIALGLRQAALGNLPDPARWTVLVSMPVMGRWAMVVGGYAVPYARSTGGLAQPFVSHLTWRHVVMATILPALWFTWLFGGINALGILASIGMLARLVTALSLRLCGGVTGDVCGMINEVAEIAFLLLAPLYMALR